ncbi:DUF4349 domain-containing protein [Paenibacillus sp. GSMTC-2017]|uniref:DUF4349 domain-containing protein n=1 Tax=Paenibacillus sp. GSMTC-2017 TaxID=2794350 RepID=UPI0018D9FB79|nr:DUF4349 domain-containing protein [Paenibacillus sp. GSMTC-2017]MBH5316911.1 DUF4349 domain-containing protein [Paenibacillus sp. GSMTC-2017]
MGETKGSAVPKRYIKQGLSLVITLLLVIAVLAGCSSSESDGESKKSVKNDAFTEASKVKYESAASEQEIISNYEAGQPEELALTTTAAGSSDDVSANATTTVGSAQGKIIYSANIVMEVDDLKETTNKLKNVIHLSGGYTLAFNDNRSDGEIAASYTIKVPAKGFMSFIEDIAKIKNNHFGQSLSGEDVTEQYVDLESRLKAKQLVEQRLIIMMEKATKAADLLQFSNQLGAIQEEIEAIKGKIRYLDNNVALSTIELRIVQTDQTLQTSKAKKDNSFGSQLSGTLSGSANVVVEAIKWIIIIFVGALPVLAVLAIVFIPIRILMKRRSYQGKWNRSKVPEQSKESSDKDD